MEPSVKVSIAPSAKDIKSLADKANEMFEHLQCAIEIAKEIEGFKVTVEIDQAQQ